MICVCVLIQYCGAQSVGYQVARCKSLEQAPANTRSQSVFKLKHHNIDLSTSKQLEALIDFLDWSTMPYLIY